MSAVSLIFPHQLFEKNPSLSKGRRAILFEDPLYFRQFPFHKKKLVLHRASMKFYQHWLSKKGVDNEYIDSIPSTHLASLFKRLKKEGINEIHYCDTTDYLVERRLKRYAEEFSIGLVQYETPQFINTNDTLVNYFSKSRDYFLHQFYMQQRKRLKVLVNDSKPVGGKWSFDEDNRKKVPKGLTLPEFHYPKQNEFVTDAIRYVDSNFSKHLGTTAGFHFPTTFTEARKWLDDFLVNRFRLFGPYEDAIESKQMYLFHSVLTPTLNTGLLTPQEVLDRILEFAQAEDIPLASLEGFIRQIIGWREFIRGVYVYQGVYQRKRNYWNHSRKLPSSFYNGTTGMPPVDKVIKQLYESAYSHHIERLMVMGNFMLLCEFHPDDVYQWFMEFYIDAYDWVMVPNVYGMSQFSDGGLMSTKPYISGSNYIIKMSDYKKGDWAETWNSLYWRFIYLHRDYFAANQRTMMVANALKKMDRETLKKHLKRAEDYLEKL